ncbi:MAG: hypothetical protein OCD02_03290 [Spirochaetaceae bacterium]
MKLKKVTIKLLLITILTGGCFITGCSSTPEFVEEREIFNGALLNNRLTIFGETLILPEGWVFIPNPSTSGTLFNFRSPEGIEGGLEVIDFEYDIEFSKLIGFYEDYVFESDEKIKTQVIEHERFGTVAVFNGIDEDLNLKSLLVADGNNVVFLHLTHNIDTAFTQEEALLILETYKKDERNWVSFRDKVDAPQFTSIDNKWYWDGDFKNGYYMAKKGINSIPDVITCLWTISLEEIDELKTNTEFDIEPFKFTLRVQNKSTDFTVYGFMNKSRSSRLYTVFEFNEVTYCLYLIQKSIYKEDNPKVLLENQEIQDLLDFNLLFSGDS